MMTRYFNNLRALLLFVVVVTVSAAIVNAQVNRTPRLEHPDLVPAEKARDVTKQLEPAYDRTNDETTYFLSGILVVSEGPGHEVLVPGDSQKRTVPSSVAKMVVYYKSPGKTRTRPTQVVLAFNVGNAFGFEFSQYRDLTVELPGEKLQLGRMNLTSRKDEGHRAWGFIQYWETLELPISVETYRKIIESKSVSIKVGAGTTTLTNAQLKQLRKFAKDLD